MQKHIERDTVKYRKDSGWRRSSCAIDSTEPELIKHKMSMWSIVQIPSLALYLNQLRYSSLDEPEFCALQTHLFCFLAEQRVNALHLFGSAPELLSPFQSSCLFIKPSWELLHLWYCLFIDQLLTDNLSWLYLSSQKGRVAYILISSSVPKDSKYFMELTNQYLQYITQARYVVSSSYWSLLVDYVVFVCFPK